MKGQLSRVLYISSGLFAVYLLYNGHVCRRPNQILLGTGFILLSLFLMHWPISFISDKGLSCLNFK